MGVKNKVDVADKPAGLKILLIKIRCAAQGFGCMIDFMEFTKISLRLLTLGALLAP